MRQPGFYGIAISRELHHYLVKVYGPSYRISVDICSCLTRIILLLSYLDGDINYLKPLNYEHKVMQNIKRNLQNWQRHCNVVCCEQTERIETLENCIKFWYTKRIKRVKNSLRCETFVLLKQEIFLRWKSIKMEMCKFILWEHFDTIWSWHLGRENVLSAGVSI